MVSADAVQGLIFEQTARDPCRSQHRPLRIVLAKVGLDGHDRGIKVVARALRDAGFHVIYAGLWQTPEAVVRTVADEDADWLGLSLLSGAHMTLVPRVWSCCDRRAWGMSACSSAASIPESDVPKLLELGVARVFGPGTPLPEIVDFLRGQRGAGPCLSRSWNGSGRRDRLALARLLTSDRPRRAGGRDPGGAPPRCRARARVVAVTGSGGVGKSTLIGKLIELLRGRGRPWRCWPAIRKARSPAAPCWAIASACPAGPDDPGVFIRSLAAPSGHEGIADQPRPR